MLRFEALRFTQSPGAVAGVHLAGKLLAGKQKQIKNQKAKIKNQK